MASATRTTTVTPTIKIRSRLLQQLDREIAAASSPLQAAPLRARRAILLTRHGDLPAARAQLTALHQLRVAHPQADDIGAWLQLAEGLMDYFGDLGEGGPDKLQRAARMARMLGLNELEALASAWLAIQAYLQQDLDGLVRHALRCQETAAVDDHGARSRLAVALAVAFDKNDQPVSALAWNAEARWHATQQGDDATLSALIFNSAGMRAGRVRDAVLSGGLVGAPDGVALMAGLQSAQNYDAVFGVAAKTALTPLLQAQLLTLQGDFAGAQALFEQHLPQAMSQGMTRLNSQYLADLAWCCAHTGTAAQALQQAQRTELEIDASCHVSDLAATHSRLAQVHAALGDASRARRHQDEAGRLWQAVVEEQRRWVAALDAAGLSQPKQPLRTAPC